MSLVYPLESKKVHPALDEPRYAVSQAFAPKRPLIVIPKSLSELTGPIYGHDAVNDGDADLTSQHAAAPIGERIAVYGAVLDEDGRGVPGALIEIWQANASGRYIHTADGSTGTIDPNFDGMGRVITDREGRYRFVTIKPGPYSVSSSARWWRPAHIHLSVFGTSFVSRIVTQMYFSGDPLHGQDAILQSIPDEAARQRLIASLDLAQSTPGGALAYHFNLVLRGREATPLDND